MADILATPVRLQRHPAECGSVCLGIVLEWLGESLSNSKLRNLCGIGRDGAHIGQLQKGAQELGYLTTVSKKGINTLKKQKSPLIIHWDLNHFLVFEGIKNDMVYLNDPAVGKRTIAIEEFKKHFTGLCIEILPENDNEKATSYKLTHYQYFFPLLWKQSYKYLLLPAFIFVILELLYAGMFNAYYDYAVANQLSRWIAVIALSGIAIVVLRYCIYSAFIKFKLHHIQELEFRLNSFFIENLIPKSIKFFESHYDGEISFRILQLRQVTVNLAVAFFSIIETLPFLVISLLIILFINPPLFLVLFLPYFFLIGYRYKIHYKLREHQVKQDVAQSQYRSALNQRLADLERFKAMGLQSALFPPLKAKILKQQNEQFLYQKSLALYQSLSQALDSITLPAVLFASSYLLLTKQLTFGAYSFTYMLALIVLPQLKQVQDKLDTYMQTKDLAKDSEEFFTCEDENEQITPTQIDESQIDKQALFQAYELNFSYNETQSSLLRNINLSVYEGDIICFIGESGCGKTTLLEVMSGQRYPTSGAMLYRQQDAYRNLDSGFVFAHQEVKGSLAEFLFADDTVDKEKIRAALSMVELESKFDFEIEKGGATPNLLETLSVGEKQRLSLARAYCFNSDIIFFDEAFSHVDIETSCKILTRMKQEKITMIMATHRSEIQEQATRQFHIQ